MGRIYGIHSGSNKPAAYLARSILWYKRQEERSRNARNKSGNSAQNTLSQEELAAIHEREEQKRKEEERERVLKKIDEYVNAKSEDYRWWDREFCSNIRAARSCQSLSKAVSRDCASLTKELNSRIDYFLDGLEMCNDEEQRNLIYAGLNDCMNGFFRNYVKLISGIDLQGRLLLKYDENGYKNARLILAGISETINSRNKNYDGFRSAIASHGGTGDVKVSSPRSEEIYIWWADRCRLFMQPDAECRDYVKKFEARTSELDEAVQRKTSELEEIRRDVHESLERIEKKYGKEISSLQESIAKIKKENNALYEQENDIKKRQEDTVFLLVSRKKKLDTERRRILDNIDENKKSVELLSDRADELIKKKQEEDDDVKNRVAKAEADISDVQEKLLFTRYKKNSFLNYQTWLDSKPGREILPNGWTKPSGSTEQSRKLISNICKSIAEFDERMARLRFVDDLLDKVENLTSEAKKEEEDILGQGYAQRAVYKELNGFLHRISDQREFNKEREKLLDMMCMVLKEVADSASASPKDDSDEIIDAAMIYYLSRSVFPLSLKEILKKLKNYNVTEQNVKKRARALVKKGVFNATRKMGIVGGYTYYYSIKN